MAISTTTAIKFYSKAFGATAASTKSTTETGSIVFDKTSHSIFVNGIQYGGNIADATFSNGILTITKSSVIESGDHAGENQQFSLDFNTLANAESVMQVFQTLHNEINAIETGAGLGESGTYTATSGANYISSATSLKDADDKLDAAIKSVSDRVSGAVQAIEFNNVALGEDSNHIIDIAVDGVYNSETNKIASQSTVTTAIKNLDGSATIASKSGNVVTIKTGVTETDGVVSNDSGTDIVLKEVVVTGAAADVSITDSYNKFTATTVEGALAELKGDIESLDVTGYTQATLGATSGENPTTSDFVIEGIKEVDGKISADSANKLTIKVDGVYNSSTNMLATENTVTNAIKALDVSNITGFGAGKTLATLTETDGKIAATFQDISITSSQISNVQDTYSSTDDKVISGKGVAAAIATLDGSHDVATAGQYTTGTGEYATYKLELYDATQTDGIVSTNNTVADTLYFSQAYSASNPIITRNDIGSLSGAMHFKGTVDGETNTLPTANITAGDVYIVSVAGTYAGQVCEVGDMVISKSTKASSITDGDWTVVTGENQVTPVQGGAELVAGAAAITIGTIDGVALTAKTTVTAGSATIASVSDGVVTLKVGITQGTGTGTIANTTGGDITLAKVATTGSATDVSITDSYNKFTATTVEAALAELKGNIEALDSTVDADTASGTGYATITDSTPSTDFKVLNSITEADGKLTAGTAYNIKKVAATASASDMTVTSGTYGGSTATTSLQTALNNLDSAISTKTAVADGSEEIVVNNSTATVIATVGGENVSTKVNFYWAEFE